MFSPSREEEDSLFEKVLFQRSTSAPLTTSGFGSSHHLRVGDSLLSDSKGVSVLNGLLGSHTLDMPGMPPGIPNRWNPRLVGDNFTKTSHASSEDSVTTSVESVSIGEALNSSSIGSIQQLNNTRNPPSTRTSNTSLNSLVSTASPDPSIGNISMTNGDNGVSYTLDGMTFGSGSSVPGSASAWSSCLWSLASDAYSD